MVLYGRLLSQNGMLLLRTMLFSLFLSGAIVACAASPQPKTTLPPPATAVPSPPAAPESDATYHFMMGHQAELAQDLDAALKEYHTALKADPKSREVKSRLAALYFALGDVTQAVQYADEVGEGTGQEPQMLTHMAGILASAGKPERALELLDKAIESDPERGESYFPKGLILLNQKRIAEAEQVVKKGLQYTRIRRSATIIWAVFR